MTIIAEYIWIDAHKSLRYKCKTLNMDLEESLIIDNLPEWNFDGSSTDQATGNDSEVYLQPVYVVKNPLNTYSNIDSVLVLCECILPETGLPAKGNTRYYAEIIFNEKNKAQPWFGLEQEYIMFEKDGKTPLGWPICMNDNNEIKQTVIDFFSKNKKSYCGIGVNNIRGRKLVHEHYVACIKAGLKISGTNAEVTHSQWEYQIGPCEGINSGDQVWMSRYLLLRLAEQHNIVISFDPKPIPGCNGTGCHINYSTKDMRSINDNYKIVVEKLSKCHNEHMKVYGEGNDKRLTGKHETAPIDKFSCGVADRGASIRIPRQTALNGIGYIEDRRPAGNVDPYLATAKIAETTI